MDFLVNVLFAFLLSASLCMETLILLRKFAFLECDSSIVSFFSMCFQPAFFFEPLFTSHDSYSLLEFEELRIVASCCFSSFGGYIPLNTPTCISLRGRAS